VITVTLSKKGTVGLKPQRQSDLNLLRTLPYVVNRKGDRGTFWTYLSDLRRDVPQGKLKWAPHVAPRLKALMGQADRLPIGNDREIRAVFAKDAQPYNFQVSAVHCGLNAERLLIADDVGLGKTPMACGIMLVGMARKTIRRAILVVPAGLKGQWYDEIIKFSRNFPSPVVVAGGSPAKRRHLYLQPWRVLIINPELVRIDKRQLAKVARSVDFVALDEASCIRNEDTDISRVMKALWHRTRYKLALTATPLENRLGDLFSIFEWVDGRVFLSRPYFDRRYIVWKKRRITVYSKKVKRDVKITVEQPIRCRNLNEVRAKIRPFYVRRRVTDPEVDIELPALIVQWERLTLPKRQRAVYDAVKDKVVDRIKGLRGVALRMPLQALRQACNSTGLVEKKGAKPIHVKIDRLRELLETELAGEQVLIFTDYERFGTIMAKELSQYRPVRYSGVGSMTKRERQRSIDAFKVGDRRILIGTMALERGHNLQCAGIAINADLPFNPARLKQRIGRIRRIGSKHHTVRVINMIALGTVEEYLILKHLYKKRKMFEGVFDEDELTLADPLERMGGADLSKLL